MARVLRSNPLTTPVSQKSVSVSDAYSIFLRSRKVACAKATVNLYKEIGDRTIVPYLTDLTDDDMSNITAPVLRQVLDDYAESHTDSGTDFLFRHMRTFVNWYWDEYDLPTKNPMKKVTWKKSAPPPKQGITREEVDALIRTAKTKSIFPERDVAMLMILCDTGIRKSSLVNLKMKDINLSRSEMIVFEKDQAFHTKAFGVTTSKAIRKYLDCLVDIKDDDPLWLTMEGKRLQKDGCREILRRLCNEAKIPMHHFHDFRRFYAMELYESTKDIYLVSRALDHKNVEVTKRYLRLDEIADQEVARIYSPMDRKFEQTGVRINR